jgi:hypothetical protein
MEERQLAEFYITLRAAGRCGISGIDSIIPATRTHKMGFGTQTTLVHSFDRQKSSDEATVIQICETDSITEGAYSEPETKDFEVSGHTKAMVFAKERTNGVPEHFLIVLIAGTSTLVPASSKKSPGA